MRKFSFLVLVLSLILLLTSCSKAGSEYLGKWQETASPNGGMLEIVRNGDSYLLKSTEAGPLRGRPQSMMEPAVLNNGVLYIGGENSAHVLTYIKSSDTLLLTHRLGGDNVEMKRAK